MFSLSFTKKYPLTFTAVDGPATVALNIVKGTPTTSGLQYRLEDNQDWTNYTIGSIINLNDGEYVQFQNTEELLNNTTDYVSFVMTGTISASGDVQSLLNYIDEVPAGAFAGLFNNCSSLIEAPKLTAKKVGANGYTGMFRGTSIIRAPELPATDINDGAYQAMFNDCSKLIYPPKVLPAKSIGYRAYRRMFRNNSALITPPKILANKFTGTQVMAGMFSYCSSLTSSPQLFATTLTNQCYHEMFWECINLVNVNKIYAKYQAPSACHSMFNACSSLITAPELLSMNLADSCYRYMFERCYNLEIPSKLPTTTLASHCYQHMFESCYKLKYTPELPATNIPQEAYTGMFKWCYSLKDMPELPATTLGNFAYYSMFAFCENLTGYVSELPAISASQYCYGQMFYQNYGMTKAPEIKLENFDVGCCERMFINCTGLIDAPELLPSTLTPNTPYEQGLKPNNTYVFGVLEEMYNGCKSLSSINVNFDEWDLSGTLKWTTGINQSGEFICPAALPDERGIARIPTNYTKVDK